MVLGIESVRHYLDCMAIFLDAVEAAPWSGDDFLDTVHFAAKGSPKFAETIAPDLRRICN